VKATETVDKMKRNEMRHVSWDGSARIESGSTQMLFGKKDIENN
jgi:hypothetical protein